MSARKLLLKEPTNEMTRSSSGTRMARAPGIREGDRDKWGDTHEQTLSLFCAQGLWAMLSFSFIVNRM